MLVIDDDSSLRLLATILEDRGYAVMLGMLGQDALDLAHEKPELILLDYHLPDIDGLQVCRALKADPEVSAIPVMPSPPTRIRCSRLKGWRPARSTSSPSRIRRRCSAHAHPAQARPISWKIWRAMMD